MILEMDVGNTRAKWRIMSSAGEIRSRGAGDIGEWIRGGFPVEWAREIKRARIACVRDEAVLKQLGDLLSRSCGVEAEIAQVGSTCGDVHNGYAVPENLGVDRWLAVVAAVMERGASVLVVDAGSALTIDLADGQGLHRGGFIIPGLRLMQEALLISTDRIHFSGEGSEAVLAFGQGTTSCVVNGSLLAIVGAIQRALHASIRMLGSAPDIYLTGGDADILVRLPEFNGAFHRPDLVMDGLRHLLP